MLILVCLSVPILSVPQGYGSPSPSAPATYAYQYKVNDDYTSTNFGQAESRDGHTAKGEYFVNLPDGRLQKVGQRNKCHTPPRVGYTILKKNVQEM